MPHAKQKPTKSRSNEATFEKIATTFQQAYEQIKTKATIPTPTPAPENASILDTLQQIKASITNLEAMQTTKNTPKTNLPDTEKTPITAAQLHKHQEQQQIRAQRIQSTIILNISETNEKLNNGFKPKTMRKSQSPSKKPSKISSIYHAQYSESVNNGTSLKYITTCAMKMLMK